jgi:hypothetical protein
MDVVDWKLNRHPHIVLLITTVAKVFRDAYEIRAWVLKFQTELVSYGHLVQI